MVDLEQNGSSVSNTERSKPQQQPFAVTGPVTFAPEFFPERIQVMKERNLDRSQDYCSGEDVSDNGSKNRDVHVSGTALSEGLFSLHDLADSDSTHTLVSSTWQGEVRVRKVDIEGPTGWYPPSDSMLWEYRVDFVSTGTDEPGDSLSEDGIISDGNDIPDQLVE